MYQNSTPESSAIIDLTNSEEEFLITPLTGVDQNGEAWSTDEMADTWWVAKTIFSRCPTVCMTMTPNMVKLQEAIVDEGLDVEIISFTVDPEFDTPERMAEYGEAYGASFDNWRFITGYTEEEIVEFVLDSFRAPVMRVEEQNDISHPTRFYLMNGHEIVRMYKGDEGFDLDATIKDMAGLIK